MDFLHGLREEYVFKPEKWPQLVDDEEDYEKSTGSNCMSYAFNYRNPIRSRISYMEMENPNCIRDNPFSILGPENVGSMGCSFEMLKECFEYNCKTLRVGCRELGKSDIALADNSERIIALVYSKKSNWHFIRRESNGTWSHKLGWEDMPKILCEFDDDLEKSLKKLKLQVVAFYAIKFT